MSKHTGDAGWPLCGAPLARPPEADSEEAERLAYIDQLKAKIRNGAYEPDVHDLARSLANMIVRDL